MSALPEIVHVVLILFKTRTSRLEFIPGSHSQFLVQSLKIENA